MSSSSRLCLLRYVASVCAFHLKVVLRRLEGVGGYVGEVVGGFCVWCVAVVAATAAVAAAAAAAAAERNLKIFDNLILL